MKLRLWLSAGWSHHQHARGLKPASDWVNAGLLPPGRAYIPSMARARRAIEIATRVSGSSNCRPVRVWMRSTR